MILWAAFQHLKSREYDVDCRRLDREALDLEGKLSTSMTSQATSNRG